MEVGGKGDVLVGGKVVAKDSTWSIKLQRSYVDATAFGELNKQYLVGMHEPVGGTFHGRLVTYESLAYQANETELSLYAYARPAWWGRLKHWAQQTDWPEYLFARGRVRLDDERSLGDLTAIYGRFTFVGPVSIYIQPMSKLEKRWARLCYRVRHPFRAY